MPGPNKIAEAHTVWTTSPTLTTTASLTWNANDQILCLGMTEINTTTLTVPTAVGLTFTQIGVTNVVNTAKLYAWSATAASSGSDTIATTSNVSSSMQGIQAIQYRNCRGFGTPVIKTSGTTTVLSLARAENNSAVAWVAGDFNVTNDIIVSPTPAGGNQLQAATVTGHVTAFAFDWPDQGPVATTSYGITGFATTGVFSILEVEAFGNIFSPQHLAKSPMHRAAAY